MLSPTERFSTRVENYIRYRPGYPPAIVDLLAAECHLTPASVMADIGFGTGLLTKLFLQHGNRVFGVEPNREMRQAGEHFLQDYPHFTSIAATAEATTLPNHSIDFVTAGQSFHWFNPEATGIEFARILKPYGWVVLVWNERKNSASPFLEAYEKLLQTFAPDYPAVQRQNLDGKILGTMMQVRYFENSQNFDFEGLKGRLLSSSYAPEAGQPNHEPMLAELWRIFQIYQENGSVTFEYTTEVYYGQINGE